ncbi:MAG TPA: hypothetical protein VIX63_01560 [Vicinamibacterales bacterium]
MTCPECGQRKARRACPALGKTICPVCCGTKRLTEIACPPGCVYLASAREHPAAVVKRQQERDVAMLLPTIRNLTERQYQLFFLFQTLIARHTPDGFARLVDDDVADAAAAMAATLETSARGVIYEHAATSTVAQRLANELKAMLAEMRQQDATVSDSEAAIVLRSIEQGARESRKAGVSGTAYLALMARLLQGAPGAETVPAAPKASSLILP